MFEIIFWLSLIAIVYAYIGYTIMLFPIAMFIKREKCNDKKDELPNVSLIISAYNEEKVIEEKLENSLQLDYPKNMLEIMVISDGSDDMTEDIVRKYTDRGVTLKRYQGRIGKTACLNNAVPQAKGDVIVFSDANSKYDRYAIRELVKHFSDPSVGYVTGHTAYIESKYEEKVLPIGIYSQIEKRTKVLESKIYSCVGADGAIFAIRKNLYRPLKDFDINDFVIPLQIVRQGFRGVIEEKALCIEKAAEGPRVEYDRQVRITNRTIRAVLNNAEMLNPIKYGFYSLELISHKVFKLLSPYFAIAFFMSNAFLIQHATFYLIVFIGQLSFYTIAAIGYYEKRFRKISTLISLAVTFVMVNMAIFMGWVRYFKGDTYVTWSNRR